MIALDDNGLVGLGDNGIFPDRFHVLSPLAKPNLLGYAAKFGEHIGVMGLVPVAKARPQKLLCRWPRTRP